MKHLKKLDAKGFAHWILPALAIVIIGGVGAYLLAQSHADVPSGSAVCGKGYTRVASYRAIGTHKNAGPAVATLYQNKEQKKVCAALQSTGRAFGVAKPMSVTLALGGTIGVPHPYKGGIKSDKGSFKYYAGPVYVSYANYTHRVTWYRLGASITYGGVTYSIGGPTATLKY